VCACGMVCVLLCACVHDVMCLGGGMRAGRMKCMALTSQVFVCGREGRW